MLSVVLLSLLLIVSSKPYYSRYNDESCSGDVVQQITVESGECFPIGDGRSTRYVISGDHVKVSFFDLPNCKGLNGTVTAVSGVCVLLNGTLTGSMRIVTAAKLQGLFPSAPATTPAVKSGSGANPAVPGNVFPGGAGNKANKKNKKTANNKNGGHGTTTCAPTAPKGRATKPPVVPMPSLFPKARPTGAPTSPGSCPKCAKKNKAAKKAAKKKGKKGAKKAAKKKAAKKKASSGKTPSGLFP